MLTTYRADLHLHTCLSPCGEDEMKPLAIVRQAKKKGLQVIAICDHNSTKNVRAVCRAGQCEGVAVIKGIEICSQEEVHILGLFDGEDSLQELQQLLDENLSGQNNPELFGEQCLCDEDDSILGKDTTLLIGATKLSVEKVVDNIHSLGGLAVASHVDRDRFSLFSQLGFVPDRLKIDALEISPLHSVARARNRFPQIKDYPVVRCSDAHRLEEIGTAWTVFKGTSPSVKELRKALLGEDGREVMN